MFENLSERLSSAFRNLSGRGTISESNVQEALTEIETALLEADVELGIAKQFCADVMSKAKGREVTKSLKPGQELVGIVHDELVALMAPTGEQEGAALLLNHRRSGQWGGFLPETVLPSSKPGNIRRILPLTVEMKF